MTTRERIFWWIVGPPLIVGLFFCIPSYEAYCEYNPQTQKEECGKYHSGLVIIFQILKAIDRGGVAITALATVVLAIFTWRLWVSTHRLWTAGERQREAFAEASAAQSDDMKASIAQAARAANAMERAASAMGESAWHTQGVANATAATVKVMRETAERQLRAYVFIENASLSNISPGEIPIGMLDMKNFGSTPAYRMTQWATGGFLPYPLTSGFPEREVSDNIPQQAMAPGGVRIMPVKFKNPITPEKIAAIKSGTYAIYIAGEITYRDAFEKERMTRFLLFSGGSNDLTADLASYHEHNEAT